MVVFFIIHHKMITKYYSTQVLLIIDLGKGILEIVRSYEFWLTGSFCPFESLKFKSSNNKSKRKNNCSILDQIINGQWTWTVNRLCFTKIYETILSIYISSICVVLRTVVRSDVNVNCADRSSTGGEPGEDFFQGVDWTFELSLLLFSVVSLFPIPIIIHYHYHIEAYPEKIHEFRKQPEPDDKTQKVSDLKMEGGREMRRELMLFFIFFLKVEN